VKPLAIKEKKKRQKSQVFQYVERKKANDRLQGCEWHYHSHPIRILKYTYSEEEVFTETLGLGFPTVTVEKEEIVAANENQNQGCCVPFAGKFQMFKKKQQPAAVAVPKSEEAEKDAAISKSIEEVKLVAANNESPNTTSDSAPADVGAVVAEPKLATETALVQA